MCAEGHTPAALRRRHKEALQPLDRLQHRLIRLVRATCTALEDHEEEAWNTSTFPTAFGLLASKCLSHAESIRALTGIGRYGDAHAILRALISDALMCQFLQEYQDRIPAWFEYARQRNTATKKERLKLEQRFSDAKVRRGLETKGTRMESVGKLFGAYSEALHGSSWGALFYGRRESWSKYTILQHGHFDNFTANILSNQTLFYVDRLLLNAVFVWLEDERSGVAWSERLLRRYSRLGAELKDIYRVHGDYLDRLFSQVAD